MAAPEWVGLAGFALGIANAGWTIGWNIWKHRAEGVRLRVTAAIEPPEGLVNPFLHNVFVRIRVVNIGRRPVKITEVGALTRTPLPPLHQGALLDRAKEGSREFLNKDFKPCELQPDNVLEENALWFGMFHENFRQFFVQDVQGRRFFISRKNFRQLRHARKKWVEDHPTED